MILKAAFLPVILTVLVSGRGVMKSFQQSRWYSYSFMVQDLVSDNSTLIMHSVSVFTALVVFSLVVVKRQGHATHLLVLLRAKLPL